MNIIIAGNGKLGQALTRKMCAEGYNVTLIDTNAQILEESTNKYDIIAIKGNCASMPVLLQAGLREADLLIAVTGADEVNLLCCSTAHALNPKTHTIARIRNPEYTDQIFDMRDVFGLSLALNPERRAAIEIERLLKLPGFLHRESFAKGRAEIVELRVDKSSKLCDIPLSELGNIIKCKVLVCTVLRGKSAIVPNGHFVLKADDRIFVTAPTENLRILLKNLGISTRRVRKVILCGGGRVSYYLANLLTDDGIAVHIIENDEKRCRDLASTLPHATVIQGDATDQTLLEAQGLANADAIVTLTGLDELNMIISLFGTNANVPLVITKLGRVENREIINTLSLGSVVCPTDLSCDNIVRYVRAMQNQSGAAVSVHTIADGRAEAVEFVIDAGTKNCRTALKDLTLRENVLIVSITRRGVTTIPNGVSVFDEGDTVVVVTSTPGIIRQFNDIFA